MTDNITGHVSLELGLYLSLVRAVRVDVDCKECRFSVIPTAWSYNNI